MNIGLALSGGGFRATVYHLGVLARLAEQDLLEKVTFLSTVSGGSLCAGLVYSKSNWGWPSSVVYKETVLPKSRETLTTTDLQRGLILRVLTEPWKIFEPRASALSKLLQQQWGITAKLGELTEKPRWLINATCYETGKNWRFERIRMGDYRFGYSHDTQVPLSDAMTASSGFPGLVGALPFKTGSFSWFNYNDQAGVITEPSDPKEDLQRETRPVTPAYSQVHLWDGGVYDNFGLEGVFDVDRGWRKDIDLLIVSDAAGRPKPEEYQTGVNALLRMITDIMMDQIHALRTRALMERINQGDPGVLLKTGTTCEHVLRNSEHADEITRVSAQCLESTQAARVENFATTINRLSPDDFELLFRHGYEVADYTLYAYAGGKFLGYANSPSAKIAASTNT